MIDRNKYVLHSLLLATYIVHLAVTYTVHLIVTSLTCNVSLLAHMMWLGRVSGTHNSYRRNMKQKWYQFLGKVNMMFYGKMFPNTIASKTFPDK